MKLAAVGKEDLQHVAKLINMLQAGEYTFSGKDLCSAGDSIRWFQRMAVSASEAYRVEAEKSDAPPVPPLPIAKEVEEETVPKAGLPDGVKMKSFHPGKLGKK